MMQLPFPNLTPYMIQTEFESARSRFSLLMEENGFKNAIKENLFLNETHGISNIDCNYHDCDTFINLKRNESRFLNVYTLNISSLQKHAGELVSFISTLETKFDIIILSEIGVYNIPLYDNLFEGFVFHYITPINNRKGGIGVYFSSSISNLVIKDEMSLKKICGCALCEFESLAFDFDFNNIPFSLLSIYRHPNGNKMHFKEALSKSLNMISKKRNVILAGDINIDLIKFHLADHMEYITTLFSEGYLPFIINPSRITSHSATCIDHIFIKLQPKNNFNCISGILYSDISDHLPCFVSIDLKQEFSNSRPNVRLYGDKQCQSFKTKMEQFDWDSIYTNEVNWYSKFITTIQNMFYSSFPIVKVSRKRSKDKPWITKGIKISIRKLHILYKKSLKSPNYSENYHIYVTNLRKIIKSAQTNFYKEIFDSKTMSAKTLWKHLNNLINTKRKTGPSRIDKILYNGSVYFESKDIATKMNDHFCTIGPKLKQKLPECEENSYKKFLLPNIMNSFYLNDVLFEEVYKEIEKLNPRKSTGPDGIGIKIVKLCPEIFAYNLTKVYNKSISEGIYPDELKTARVLALYKKGSKSDPNNYRPISILSCFNKIFERLVCKQLLSYLEKYKILFKFQFGFRENHSTILALTEITDKIRFELDESNYVLGLFVDLTKAFDTVDHEILLYKMN